MKSMGKDPKGWLKKSILEVFHDGRSIVLKGLVHSLKEFHLVEEIVHKIADPHPIHNELHHRE